MDRAADQLVAIGAPVWVTVVVIVAPMLLTFSKAASNLPGALGSASRWWQSRQLREVERSEDLDKAIEAAVKRRVEEELAPILARMKRMEEGIRKQEDEIALRDEFILLQARYLRSVQEWAVENGHELPFPGGTPRFTQWVQDRVNGEKP